MRGRRMEKRRTITYIRYLLSAALTAGLFLLAGCGQSEESAVILRVANSEEYIDEGGWDEEERIELEDGTSIIGTNSMIDDFEQWYKETYGVEVRVEYSAYGTNEELYNQMSLGNTFDVVCPSEYMIMKLMGEGRLQPFSDDFFDRSDKRNYYIRGLSPYIDDIFHQLKQGDQELSRYGAGYMWGVMGIVYNPQKVSREAVKHWDMLLDPAYHKQITMKDSVRDSYFVGLGILHEKELLDPALVQSSGYSDTISRWLNDTGQETVDKVEEILSDMRENAYSLETDSGKADLVTGRVVANMQWSGDAVYSLDQAEEDGVRLAYSVPEECSNLWFDGWCMMRDGLEQDGRKQQAAQAWINFLSRPDNVIRNMYYVGYTSVIAGGDSDLVYQYAEYCYGAEEDGEDTAEYPMSYFFGDEGDHILVTDREQLERQLYAQYPPEEVLRRSAVMNCFSEEANRRISQMWINIRCFNWM
jgi:Spermidine/putrescine-binding periplasmic protein